LIKRSKTSMENPSNSFDHAAFLREAFREHKVWDPRRRLVRYGTFERFEATIADGLFVPKATKFSDRNEGVLHYFGLADDRPTLLSRQSIRASMDWVYVSCWTDDTHENHGMWKLYGQDNESVAIETTEVKLRIARMEAKPDLQTYIDDVRYKSPDDKDFLVPEGVRVFQNRRGPSDTIPVYAALFCYLKHSGYVHEKEVRLAAIDENASSTLPNPRDCIRLPVAATREMITGVVLGPDTPRILEVRTAELIRKHNMDPKLLRRSSLEDPFA